MSIVITGDIDWSGDLVLFLEALDGGPAADVAGYAFTSSGDVEYSATVSEPVDPDDRLLGSYRCVAKTVADVIAGSGYVTIAAATTSVRIRSEAAVELDAATAAQLDAIELDAAASVGYLNTLVGRVTSTVKTMWDALTEMISGTTPNRQFTAKALELGPAGSGGGGGSATLEKQEEILEAVADVTSSVAAYAARIALEVSLTGFPSVICRNSDYVEATESEIRLTLEDLTGAAITEIAGTPVADINWLFGMGIEKTPNLISGTCTWDATTDELVIEIPKASTAGKPTGSLTWQVGVSIASTERWLGGGTTRLIERQF